MIKILLTGGTGFIGKALVQELAIQGKYQPVLAVRQPPKYSLLNTEIINLEGNILDADLSSALVGIYHVIHLASRVHLMKDDVADPLEEFRKINVIGTLKLAKQAALSGVKRFIFVSSIKVNGENTQFEKPFKADDLPAPTDPYGISKYEAEEELKKIADETGMEVVIIRPTLVYGPGVRANFLNMIRWVNSGIPLPLGSINNKRTLVGLDNLVDLILICIDHSGAGNQIILAGDGEDISTTELLKKVGKALGKPTRLIPVPPFLLKTGAWLVGKPGIAQRLCGNLQVDISKTLNLLGWKPPVPLDEGIRKTVEQWKLQRNIEW